MLDILIISSAETRKVELVLIFPKIKYNSLVEVTDQNVICHPPEENLTYTASRVRIVKIVTVVLLLSAKKNLQGNTGIVEYGCSGT